jgi:hypothetical protein
MNRLILITALLFCLLPAAAQTPPKDINQHQQGWLGYFNQTRLTNKFGFWFDVHARRIDWLERWNTLMIRPGVTYYVNDHVRLTAGYALVGHYPAAGLATIRPEHRAWQQVLWTSRSKKLQTQQWVRLEQRFNRKIANDQLQEGYNFNYRFRYLLALFVPLKGDFIQKGVPFIAFNNEVHINAGKQITYNHFDQNRFFVGLGYQFSKTVNAQLGYMNLFQQLPAGNRFNNNHVLRLFFFHNVDLRRKEAE